MTVVLLLITLIASVAVRETAKLGFQTRYEQTKERLDMIKQAILGNPRQIINGQQAVSGFVADMGRLPHTLRELIEDYDCDGPSADGNGDTNFTNDGGCPWILDSTYNSGLGSGWRGPYLTISGNPANNDALTDGWGRTSTDSNYGWDFFDWNTYPPISPSSYTSNLIIQSLGKDQSADTALPTTENYDNDYPVNIYPLGSTSCSPASPCFPNPTVRQQDWQVDISNGISVSFINSTRVLPVKSFCTDTSKTTKASCVTPAAWYGNCNTAGYYNADSCATAAIPGTWGYCSDGVSTTTTACNNASGIWGYCSDGVSATPAACTTAKGIWATKGFACSDQSHSTQATCIAATKTWYGCTDGASTNLAACTSASGAWSISTINIPGPPLLSMPICMKVFYRKPDSSIGVLVSDGNITNDIDGAVLFDPNVIIADGSSQTIRFTNFRDSANTIAIPATPLNIPIGNNAIGIYQYDGTSCSTTTVFYPADRQNPIQLDFQPHTILPVINW